MRNLRPKIGMAMAIVEESVDVSVVDGLAVSASFTGYETGKEERR